MILHTKSPYIPVLFCALFFSCAATSMETQPLAPTTPDTQQTEKDSVAESKDSSTTVNYTTAPIELLTGLAAQDNLQAQLTLADRYSKGEGVTKDAATAFTYYFMAAEQGNTRAQYNVAVMYTLGIGVVADDKKASKFTHQPNIILWVN